MSEEITKKIRTRKILFIVFLVITLIFLLAVIISAITADPTDFLPYIFTFILGVICGVLLIPTIIFGVKFRKLTKEKATTEN